MLTFYPLDQQALFTNREYELAQLYHYRQALLSGPVENMALFGLRRIGKTLLLKEFVRRTLESEPGIAPVFMDFSTLASSPENFALGYCGLICYWLLSRGEGDAGLFLSAGSLPGALLQYNAADLYALVEPLLHELDKARPDRQALLRMAFHFPQQIAGARATSLVLIFDEFQEIRTLKRYPNSQNVLALLRSEMQAQSKILYILSGSAVSALTDLLSNPESPLFAQFARLSIGPFNRQDSSLLVHKLTGGQASPDLWPLVHSLTYGYPFYITAVCRRLMSLVETVGRPLDAETVKQAFLTETLAPHGRIYDFCRYVYDLSLQKASGYGALKATLQILASEEGLTATQVGRRLHVSSATASDYLRWLIDVDLVQSHEHRYTFQDPVLRFWVANTVRGIEVSLDSDLPDLAGLMSRLEAQFQRASEELGEAQESPVRELMRHFDGQVVGGSPFGRPDSIRLPRFTQVEAFRSTDGQIELDAIGVPTEGPDWIVEVKWKNKRVGRKELEHLYAQARAHSAQAWYISRGGFTEDARQFAAKNKMFITDAQDLKALKNVIAR